MSKLKWLLVIIIALLVVFGAYKLYQNRTAQPAQPEVPVETMDLEMAQEE